MSTTEEFQIVAHGVPVSVVFPDRKTAEVMLGLRDFEPGEVTIEVVRTTSEWSERALAFTNAFGEDMVLPLDQQDFDWWATNPAYSNVRWVTRTVTHTTTPWKTEENR